jgi:hypothetical protein
MAAFHRIDKIQTGTLPKLGKKWIGICACLRLGQINVWGVALLQSLHSLQCAALFPSSMKKVKGALT